MARFTPSFICSDELLSQKPTYSTNEWGKQEYYIKNVTTSTHNHFLQSASFPPPGGTYTVTTELSVSVSISVGIDLTVVEAALGVDLGTKFTISASYTASIPETEPRVYVQLYARFRNYKFEVWEDDLFFDDYICDGEVSIPYDYYFISYKASDVVYLNLPEQNY
ncbi:MAG: hypothetical protein HFE63_02850 [Clostridiales bacterium]|nr:hypothetical protein [Clostridiales bacterium]